MADDNDIQDTEQVTAQSMAVTNPTDAATPAKKKKKKKKKNKKKKNKPGKYSKLVIDAIRRLGEKNGCSLVKIYNEAKKVSWFDQQNGRTYLRYSVKALLQNDSLIQVRGTNSCAGSFKLNKKKFEKPAAKPAKKSSTTGGRNATTSSNKNKSPTKSTKAKTTPKKKTLMTTSPKKTLSRAGVVSKAAAKRPSTTTKGKTTKKTRRT
ncbi:histone H1.10 [Megalops cyprinoides]|uniref:histone H1.10 n=1 Tax=Megalops cyprinoides TaxID=118141 RepID=UPI0018643FC2|nr:histone H1.10 [Megalops cyprinoides]